MNNLTDAELEAQELANQIQMRDDIAYLLDNPQFQRAILKGYIDDTALVVGSTFSNDDSEINSLKAISHLKMFIESNQ